MSYYEAEEIYDLKMEALKLKQQNKKLREALKFYADESHYRKECVDSRFHSDEEVLLVEEVIIDNGRIARNTLMECGL